MLSSVGEDVTGRAPLHAGTDEVTHRSAAAAELPGLSDEATRRDSQRQPSVLTQRGDLDLAMQLELRDTSAKVTFDQGSSTSSSRWTS